MTWEQENKLEALYAQGVSNSEIARQIGVERHTVGKYVKKHNLVSPKKIKPGQKYNRLTVVEQTQERDNCGRVIWLCRCDCGNLTKVDSSSLRNGNTKSCGCLKKENFGDSLCIDLTGQRFGKLLVLERVENTWDGRARWKCQCDCGTTTEVAGELLRSGHTQSCGCMTSKGEYLIRQYLNQHNIDFQTQYMFSDLVSQKGYPLRFDFAIFNTDNSIKCLIEYDGE